MWRVFRGIVWVAAWLAASWAGLLGWVLLSGGDFLDGYQVPGLILMLGAAAALFVLAARLPKDRWPD